MGFGFGWSPLGVLRWSTGFWVDSGISGNWVSMDGILVREFGSGFGIRMRWVGDEWV